MGRVRRAVVVRWLAWLFGLGLVVYLVYQVGPASIWAALSGVGYRILWLVAAYVAAQAVMSLPWALLLPRPVRPSLGEVFRSRMAASGLNALLPLVGAGEVVRLMWLRRSAWSEGAAAMIADRVMFAVASAVWVIAGALAIRFLPNVGQTLAPAVTIAALALAGMAAAVGVLARKGRTLAFVQRWGAKLWSRVTDLSADEGQMAARAVELDAALQRVFRDPRRLCLAGLIHVVGRGFMTLEIFLALRALDVPADAAQVLVLQAVPVALAFVGAAIPSQMGLAEGALAGVTAALGLGSHAGLALVLLQRARQLLFVPVTMLLLHGQRPPAKRRDSASMSSAEA